MMVVVVVVVVVGMCITEELNLYWSRSQTHTLKTMQSW